MVKVPLGQGSFAKVPLDQVPLGQVPLVKVPLTPNLSFPIRKLSVQILIFYASNMINVVGEL